MIVDPGTVTMAKRNGRTARNLYVPLGGRPINVDQVVDLLAGRTSPRAQPGSRALLREMAMREWLVTATVHPGGFGGDPTPHITVRTYRRQYHLRLDGSGSVFDITFRDNAGPQRLAGNLPWVAPGS
jgi:hypothetical protein